MEYLRSQAARFPDLDLDGPPTEGLTPRDAALAHAINDAVARRWLTLEAVLQTFLKRPFAAAPSPTRAALLAGAAQLVFLDRIPDHAAISESVEYVNVRAPKTSGVVNAVLRGVARAMQPEPEPARAWTPNDHSAVSRSDGRVVRFSRPVFTGDESVRVAQASGCPVEVIAGWTQVFGAEAALSLAMHSIVEPPLTLNTTYARAPLDEGLTPHAVPGCHVFRGDGAALRALLARDDGLWVQDAAATGAVQLAAAHASVPRSGLIVDLCAGQGTKTRQLAHAFQEATILATDTDTARFEVLRSTFAAHPRVRVVEAAAVEREAGGKAALVVLDVPCSNSGVLARRPEAKYRLGPAQAARLLDVQRRILARGAGLLAPGGSVLYSTCSIDHAENEEQIKWAASLGLSPAASKRTMPSGSPWAGITTFHDGSFAAVLGRVSR